jgi:sugar lactone lactonase YvrE
MSDEAVAFDCPSCGGPLERQGAVNNLVTCPYCGKNVIVPESLRVKARSSNPVIEVDSDRSVRIDMGENAGQSDALKALLANRVVGRQPAIKVTRWLTCSIIAFVGLMFAISIISFVAPLLATTFITREVSKIVPGNGQSIDPEKLIQVGPTIEAALTQAVGPLAQRTAIASFYTPELAFGEEGNGPGMFADTRWLALDAQGNIYSADYQNGRVQKFDAEGKYASLWNVKPKVPLRDIAVSRSGVAYVSLQGEILKFNVTTGEALGKLAYSGRHFFSALATTPDGGLVAITDGETLVRFDANEQVTLTIADAVSTISEDSEMDVHPAVDGVGNLYLLGTTHDGVFVYSPQGKFLNRIGSEGNDPDQLRAAEDIVVDGKGRIFISDVQGVKIFTTDGRYQGLISVKGAAFGLALDDSNRLYVLSNAPLLYRFVVGEVKAH